MLKREGLIKIWHDRRIGAGNEIDQTINHHLESDDIIILLVSPHFIASDYYFDREMTRAMERHEAKEARVIPVILDHCDWKSAPFGKLLAVPTDGKPIAMFSNQNEAFLEVATAVRTAIEELTPISPSSPSEIVTINDVLPPKKPTTTRSSNLRLKKSFTDQERDDFLESTFEYIAKYFENSLEELKLRNPEISTKYKRIDETHFTSTIYISGNSMSECTVQLGGVFDNSISYSSSANARTNSCNESMSIKDDGYALFMKPFGMANILRGEGNDKLLSEEGTAEYFWQVLIAPLQ